MSEVFRVVGAIVCGTSGAVLLWLAAVELIRVRRARKEAKAWPRNR